MAIDNLIKSLRNIMRKDSGIAGDGQRIEQIIWLLFLKLFDDQEKYYELRDKEYSSPIPDKLRWRNWAQDPEGVTGDELLKFVNGELLTGLEELEVAPDDRQGLLIRTAFEDVNNYMKSGTLIRQVVNEVNKIDFNKTDDRHLLNDIYEKLLKELQGAGDYGEFYTPRPLTKFVVEMVNPKLGDKILDPACGTGGFLVNSIEYIREHEVKSQEDEQILHESIYGVELKSLPHLLAITNMMLHGIEVPDNIRRDDMLSQPLTNYGPRDRVNVIVANPPFGASVKDGTEMNFPSDVRTKETADLFLVLFIHLLKDGGRAGVVLPDGTLFGEGAKTRIKEKLLTECNLHTIVRLPSGVFAPYSGVNTNLLFFDKGQPTEEVWYYELPLPDDLTNGYTKGRGIKDEEFDPVREWWDNREENQQAWKVSIDEVKDKNYNLDFKNPNAESGVTYGRPTTILNDIQSAEQKIMDTLNDIAALLKK